jgi:DNA-binding transcriptional ArsR family regulator
MAKKPVKTEGESTSPGLHTVTDLAQVRALADPLRLKILGALIAVPRTTKQVADLLGEKPTKLYHHVEALERVGLIRLTETRPNRGTVEKYFQAIAGQFRVAASVLSPDEGPSAQEAMLTSILDTARTELLASLRPVASSGCEADDAPLVARVTVRGSSEEVREARRQLLHWIEKLKEAESRTACEGAVTYTFTVVVCRTETT